METLYLGIDVGGTRMTGALATESGQRLRTERRSTDRGAGAAAGLALLIDIARTLLNDARARGSNVARVGVGFGGPVDAKSGIVLLSHHVAGWENLPLKAKLEEALDLPAAVDNDCNAGALGEWKFGAGRGARDVLYVNIGTGIGGGVIADGKLVRGVVNGAGEIGHMVIDPAGPVCTCGKRGCLESLASGSYITRRARELVRDRPGSTRLGPDVTSEEVFAAAREGDSLALEIVSSVADALAHAIGNALTILNSELVILGGGVAENGEILLAPLRERLRHYVLPFHADSVRIVTADLGYDAGVMGALALAIEGIVQSREKG